jgi:hypothetical protein
MALAEALITMTYHSTDALVKAISDDPSTSYWLKNALEQSLERDPIDAVNDSRLLADVMQSRLEEVLHQSGQRAHG